MLISIISVLYGCEKNITTVEGTVVNSGTKEPIDSVLVVLQDGIAAGGALGGGHTVGDGSTVSTYTNRNGHFSLKLEGESPYLWIKKNRYSWYFKQDGAAVGVQGFKSGDKYSVVLEMDAVAYFDPTFKNNFQNINDTLRFADYSIDEFTKKNGIETTIHWDYVGCDFYRPYYKNPGLAVGDKYHLYMLEVLRNGTKLTIIDSVYIKSFTTFTDIIYY